VTETIHFFKYGTAGWYIWTDYQYQLSPETEIVYSEVTVYCWRPKVSVINQCKKRYIDFMPHMRAKAFNHQLQLLAKLRVKRSTISLLCILDHHYHPLKFQGGLLVDVSGIVYNRNCAAQIGSMDIQDRATAQAVSLQPLTAESRVQARVKPCGIWWTKWHWGRFFSEFFGFPLPVSFRRRSQ
jgi:hypothetical protein